MKTSEITIKIIFISFLLFITACSSSDEAEVVETDDPVEETELRFRSVTQNVTFDVCTSQYCSIKQIAFLNEEVGYAVTGVQLYKTNTGGETWEYLLNQDIVGRLIPLTEELMFLNVHDGILKTTNGGSSWTNSPTRPFGFICESTGSINPGIIEFVDSSNGFIQDKCDRGQLYKTSDSGNSWERIFNSDNDITEFHFRDANNGFVIVNDILYLTENAGQDWTEKDFLPNTFDYVIEKGNFFLFPDGTSNVDKPNLDNPNSTVTTFDVNQNGDIAVILYDDSLAANNWQLMLYINNETPEWIRVDQLPDLNDPISVYSAISLTNERSMYIGESRSGVLLKYYVE